MKTFTKTIFVYFASIMLVIALLSVDAHAETIFVSDIIDSDNAGYILYMQEHPDISIETGQGTYGSISQMSSAMLTGQYQIDLIGFKTKSFNLPEIMEHQYLVDLSTSEVIRNAVERMHPALANVGMIDGHIYAVPNRLTFSYIRVNESVWEENGMTLDDVPQSFPELLDFLEVWCERLDEGKVDAHVFGGFDTFYSKTSYSSKLVNLLVDSFIMQEQYAGHSLDFQNNEFLALLNRCLSVGKKLYELEPRISESFGPGAPLFTQDAQMSWPQNADTILFLRLNDDQPKLIEATMGMFGIYAGSEKQELTIELLERIVVGPESPLTWNDTLLYMDAEPKINNNYESSRQRHETNIQKIEIALQNSDLSASERADLEDELEFEQERLAHAELDENKYHINASQLEDFRTYVNYLYFPTQNVFHKTDEGVDIVESLKSRFVSGLLSADQFASEMTRIAIMIEMENQ